MMILAEAKVSYTARSVIYDRNTIVVQLGSML
jgi:hypothetical protein